MLLSFAIFISINHISITHIQQRLIQKKSKLVANLSGTEINDLIKQQGTFTDYNLLKEEYIILQEMGQKSHLKPAYFTKEIRSIEGNEEEYQILVTPITYGGKRYRLELGETMSAVAQLDHTISIFTFIILIIAIALTIMADLAFTRFLLNPFYKIIDQKINKVNDPKNFNYQAIETGTEDFRILDQSISTLMSKMASLIQTEKEFIANVSHELLTPISILNSRLENLLNQETLTEDGENKLFACLKTLGRLKSIINSLLLISKVENNQFVQQDNISIRETVQGVYEELEHRLLMMKLSFIVDVQEDFQFRGNQSLFHTLVMNIVNNAIKYNVADGRITVHTRRTALGFELDITDTGAGMEQEKLESVFNRFEKLDSDRADSYGLGLAIAQSIAIFHGIILSVESKKQVGTTVRLSFSA